MSTATAVNGAATEAAFQAVSKATSAASKAVGDAAASIGPSVESVTDKAKEAGQSWLEQSKTVTTLSLDAYDAGVKAYLEFTRSVAAASKVDWAIDLTESNAKIVSEFAARYSTVARDMLNK